MSQHKSSPAETLLGLLVGAALALCAIVYHVYTQRIDALPQLEEADDDHRR